MQPFNGDTVYAFGTDSWILSASFAPNGVSAPVTSSIRNPPGLTHAVARTGVGLFSVTLDVALNLPELPAYIESIPQVDAFANWFDTLVVGEFNRTTRAFSIQCHRGGVAQEVAVGAGARVNWMLHFRNSTSR